MAKPDRYWLERLKKDRALAERAAHEVEEEVRRAYRSQYLQVARKLDLLYAEANRTGTLSRTKLWNYKRWRELEADLVKYCEAGHVIQRDAITKALDSVFEDVIGTGVEVFQREKYILPYTPRAVIDTAWSGEHYSERIWKNQQALAARLREDAQQILMGDKSPAEVKRMLQKDYDVSWGSASRLVDTELSYVVNRANAENYRRMGVQKVTIVNLDVNTCEKCKALEGEVFALEDAPVLPIHPRCHCSYCAPRDGDAAEITASGNDLEEVYQRKRPGGTEGVRSNGLAARNPSPANRRGDGATGVKGFGEAPKQYAPKGTSPSRLQAKVDEAAKAFRKPEVEPEKANAQAIAGNARSAGNMITEAENVITSAGNAAEAGLPASEGNDIMAPSTQAVGDGVHTIASIQNDKVSTHWGKDVIQSVVLTDERIGHIKERHPGAYEEYGEYVADTIENPEYILDDAKNEYTATFIRSAGGNNLNVVVKLALKNNKARVVSSVITLYPVSSKRLKRLLRRSLVVYKKPLQ